MFIIFGIKGWPRSGDPILTEQCPVCGRGQHDSYGITQYFHIFWIPILPFRRLVGLRCQHCNHAREGREVPELAKRSIGSELFSLVRLLPFFSGTFVIVALVFSFIGAENRTREHDLRLLGHPMKGDVYEMKINDIMPNPQPGYPYMLARVATTDNHSVFLEYSVYTYDNTMGTSEAITKREFALDSYYMEGWNRVEIDTLLMWRKNGDLLKVLRPVKDDRKGYEYIP